MSRKRKRRSTEQTSPSPLNKSCPMHERAGRFLTRHAMAGFLTGAGSALGAVVVRLLLN
jgi:hypothetical protein